MRRPGGPARFSAALAFRTADRQPLRDRQVKKWFASHQLRVLAAHMIAKLIHVASAELPKP